MDECCLCRSKNHLYPMDCPGLHRYCLGCIKGLCISTSPSAQPVKCPECRYRPDRKHIRNICNDAGQIQKISVPELYNDIDSRPYVWLYEGRNNGWWYYDYELQDELESAWKNGQASLSWYICGQSICIDFQRMIQENQTTGAVRAVQRLKRCDIDVCGLLIKGVAGMM